MKKNIISVITSIFLIMGYFSMQGCSTSESVSGEREVTQSSDTATYHELADYLRRIPGIRVTGSGQHVQVQVRGISSFSSDTRPLYVVDGQVRGTDYVEVNRFIDIKEVMAVRLLTGSDAAAYGVRGANGVIEIDLKR